MALSREDLITLAKVTANATPHSQTAYSFQGESFSYEALQDTLRAQLRELAGTYALYRENKNTIYSLIEETFDDVLPKKVIQQYGEFAEVKTFAQGDKPVFTQRISSTSKRRAKQFITKVGLAGRYEVFKLDGKSFEIPTSAYGGAAQIGFEEWLDGRVDLADVYDIVMEGLDDCVFIEIERALRTATDSLTASNKATQDEFVEAEMDRLLRVADSYGVTSTIYCSPEFAATMVPAEGWRSPAMMDERWNNGYLANYKGHRVIVLNQSYEDETNTTKTMDPSRAYIIPTGDNSKPVKIAFEGQTIVEEYDNRGDRSREIQVYKKMGVGAIVTNNICVYINSSLTV